MTDKELKKLSRSELLEIILLLQEKQAELMEENSRLRAKQEEQALLLRNNGALGEAAKQLNAALVTLKTAADRYVAQLEATATEVILSKTRGKHNEP